MLDAFDDVIPNGEGVSMTAVSLKLAALYSARFSARNRSFGLSSWDRGIRMRGS
jgi:hypothetical protein